MNEREREIGACCSRLINISLTNTTIQAMLISNREKQQVFLATSKIEPLKTAVELILVNCGNSKVDRYSVKHHGAKIANYPYYFLTI